MNLSSQETQVSVLGEKKLLLNWVCVSAGSKAWLGFGGLWLLYHQEGGCCFTALGE